MKKILAVLATATLVLSACNEAGSGAGGDDPKAALSSALDELMNADALTSTIRLDSDTESLVALGEGDLDEETAEKILTSSIVASGVHAENPEDAQSQFIVNIAGNDAVEMRVVEGDMYMRADVAGLVETFGEDPAQLDAFAGQIQGQPGFEWVDDALAGDWLVLRDFNALAQQFGGAQPLSGEQQEQMMKDIHKTIESNATVTDEGDGHLAASLPMRDTLRDLMASFEGTPGMPTGAELDQALNEIPDEDFVVDFFISDGGVERMSVDFLQFEDLAKESGEAIPEGVETFGLSVEFAEFDGTIEPVADATQLDPQAIMQGLSGLMTGAAGMGGGAGAPAGFDCKMLKGSPPEVIELYAEECPQLQK